MRFSCTYCDKQFVDKKDCKKHEAIHERSEKFKCTKCTASFKDECKLNLHFRKAHNTTGAQYNCTFCSAVLTSKFEWAVHELKHAGWKYYKCVRCGKDLVNASMFQRHLNGKDTMSTCPGGTDMSGEELKIYRAQCRKDWESDHARIIGDKKTLEEIAPKNEKPIFTCRFCQQSFTRKLEWAVHELRHTGWKQYKCVKCGKECGNAATFSQHVHRKVESDDCPGGEGLTKEEMAAYHKESKKDWQFEHTHIIGSLTTFNEIDFKKAIPKFKCCFCSKEFDNRSSFAIHELRHTGWNHFKCIKCGKECSNASTFSDHAYKKKGNKTCPGGIGLTQTDLANYRKQSAKDWAAEHTRIIGGMTQREKDEIAKKNFTRTYSSICEKPVRNETHYQINKLLKPVYSCTFCDMKFGTKFAWACHELEHKDWKYYQCAKCGREFDRFAGQSAFYEHIRGKRKKQTCPGGSGMNKKDFEAFRNLCRKDWQAEHDRIIGKKENSVGPRDNIQNDSQCDFSSSNSSSVSVHSKVTSIQQGHNMKNCSVILTQLNTFQVDKRSSILESTVRNSKLKAGQVNNKVKDCSVVLTQLNIITLMPDLEN